MCNFYVSIALALKTPRLVTTDICNDPDLNFVDTYFLGRWCFQSLDSENAAVKGNKISLSTGRPYKLSADYSVLVNNQQLLEELVPVLNRIHNVSESIGIGKLFSVIGLISIQL